MNTNLYTKKVVTSNIGSADAYIYRDGKEITSGLFQSYNPFKNCHAAARDCLDRAHKWADEMICVLQEKETDV